MFPRLAVITFIDWKRSKRKAILKEIFDGEGLAMVVRLLRSKEGNRNWRRCQKWQEMAGI
jgi:hypothetical protein